MLKSIFSKPYSWLFIVGDNADWVIDVEARAIRQCAEALGIRTTIVRRAYFNLPQAVHYTSQFSLNEPSIYKSRQRLSVDYYHGKPEQGENFRKCFESLKAHHQLLSRVRVSTREMENLIKSSGIDPQKVMRIPIGIDAGLFTPQTPEKKRAMRERLGIPEDAFVIGSFQKDGVGWGEGNEPKLIKGPDVFLHVVGKLKQEVPNLFVLLSGPARGYVKHGLEELGIPYRHEYLREYSEVAKLYDALDLYIIASREEGGPKSVLESMAKGVPLVTTAVGQAKDLVINGENALISPIDDSEALYQHSLQTLRDLELRKKLIHGGFTTARDNSYESQLPLWKEFFAPMLDI